MDPLAIRSGIDRISDLPSNVINHILAFLPFKDAVRTSSLSKKWKDKWHTLPRIIIDEEVCKYRYGWRRLEGMLNYILTIHKGRIEKFSVLVQVTDTYNVKSWIRRLEKKGIQELFLHYRRRVGWQVPSNLFSCQKLRKLSLCGCVLKPSRSSRGFQSLISLELNKVDIKAVAFEKLICSCPLLEQLRVRKMSCVDHLQINVPKLKYFWFAGALISLCFNTPFLEVVSISSFRRDVYDDDEGTKFDLRFKITGLPSTIKELNMRCEFQRYMAACETLSTEDILYSRLSTLVLHEFCFEKVEQVSCLVSLIGSSINLTTLDTTACGCIGEVFFSEALTKFWEKQNNDPLISNQLKKVRVRSFHGNDPEMKFIEYVMTNSPALEEMIVERFEDSNFDGVKGVLQLCCKTSTQLSFIAGNNNDSDDTDNEDSRYSGYHSNDSYTQDSD